MKSILKSVFLVYASFSFGGAFAQTVEVSTANIASAVSQVDIGMTSVEIPMELSQVTTTAITAYAPVAGVQMTVLDPSGTPVIPSGSPLITFTASVAIVAGVPGGVFNGVDIPVNIDGIWKLRFSFPPAATKTLILASWVSKSPYKVGTTTDRKNYFVGETGIIGTFATKDANVVLGSSPVVTITKLPSGTPVTVSVNDAGNLPDGKASDGVFAGTYLYSSAGAYRINVTINIPSSSGNIVRTSEQEVTVNSPTIKLNSATVETVAAGVCARSIGIRMDVTTATSGKYIFRGGLTGTAGATFTVGETYSLAAGTQSVLLPFPADLIKSKLGYVSPLKVDWLAGYEVLTDTVDRAFEKFDIGAYAGTVCPDPITLVRQLNTTETLQGTLISALNFSFPVNVTTAGTYDITFSVVGPNGEPIDGVSLTKSLVVGNNTITFSLPGEKFAKVNGPYRIAGLLVVGQSDSASLLELGATGAYTASQFVGFVGPVVVQASVPVPVDNPAILLLLASLIAGFGVRRFQKSI